MKNFLIVLLKGLGFILILSVSSFAGLSKGVWGESERLAKLWEYQLGEGNHRVPPSFGGAMFWILRFFGFSLMITYLVLFVQLVEWIFKR